MKLPWVMQMQWRDLLFLHWPVPAGTLRPFLPGGVALDTFDGQAWLSVLPFAVTGFRPRGVPVRINYGQVNVRTYVRVGRVPGIWTFSLDAAHAPSVRAARWFYGLPYFDARVHLHPEGGWMHARSTRRGRPDLTLSVRYQPAGPVCRAKPGSLDHWLTERRSLFTTRFSGRVWRADVQHEPWPLQDVRTDVQACTLPAQLGMTVRGSPLAHYSRVVHVRGWPPVPATGEFP